MKQKRVRNLVKSKMTLFAIVFFIFMGGCEKERNNFSFEKKSSKVGEKSLILLKGRNNNSVTHAQKWFNDLYPQTRSGKEIGS